MLHHNTPLLESLPLSERAGRRVFLKMDAMQPSGSFKIRGIGHACEQYRARGAQRFLASSGGNAGLAVAYAGRKLGVPVEIVVPETTKLGARRAILAEGATLHIHGTSWNDAHVYAQAMMRPDDRYIHPFEDPLLWDGHSTLIDEVVAAGVRPDAVVLSVGGGGLLCGIVAGLQRHGLHDTVVYAVEPEGANSFAQALAAGKVVEIQHLTSLAVSLGARRVTPRALEVAAQHPVRSIITTDAAAMTAIHRFLRDHRVLVELGCSAALAPIYDQTIPFGDAQTVLAIVCGGMNTSIYLDHLEEAW